MCVLSIKVPIRKKYGNLFNDPRIYYLFTYITYMYIYINNCICVFIFVHFHIYICVCVCVCVHREKKYFML